MSTITAPRAQGYSFSQLQSAFIKTIAISGAMLSEMSLLDHLEELRRRILKALLAVAVALIACWTYTVQLIDLAQRPVRGVQGIQLIAIEATEIFSLYFQAAFLGAICIASPVILWQVWQFISPGLYKHERRYAGPFILSTTVAFVLGAIFAYAVMLPLALQLMASMALRIKVPVTLSVSSYFDMFSWMLLSMGLVFQIPPIIFILSRIGLASAGFLARKFKYAVLLSVVAGAIITPSPDIAPMLLVAVPIITLYAIGILVALVFGRSRKTEE